MIRSIPSSKTPGTKYSQVSSLSKKNYVKYSIHLTQRKQIDYDIQNIMQEEAVRNNYLLQQ